MEVSDLDTGILVRFFVSIFFRSSVDFRRMLVTRLLSVFVIIDVSAKINSYLVQFFTEKYIKKTINIRISYDHLAFSAELFRQIYRPFVSYSLARRN